MTVMTANASNVASLNGFADLGERTRRLRDAKSVSKIVVDTAAPVVAREVARGLNADPAARRSVVQAYLTSKDPMAEYREVAAYDFITALANEFPSEFVLEYEVEGPSGGELFGLDDMGRSLKKAYKSVVKKVDLKKVGKYVAIGLATAAAVAATVVTAGAAAPAIAAAVSVGGTIASQQKAKKEAKKMAEATAVEQAAYDAQMASAYPPVGTISSTTGQAMQTYSSAAEQVGAPQAAGAAMAAQQMVQGVVPQAMASYAAQQVAGKTPEQLRAEFGVTVNQADPRVAGAAAVAAGGEPSTTPGWLVPAAVGGGGLLVALVTGVI